MTEQTPSPPWVLSLKPYVPGKPAGELQRDLGISDVLKLASNENALGPSPLAVAAMVRATADAHIYSDPATHALRERLSRHLGVSMARIIVGNGSNECITHLVRCFATPDDNVVVSQYGFVAYRVVAGAAGVDVREVPVRAGRSDLDAMAAACDAQTRLLFVANPNNPTGTYNARAELERLLDRVPSHVMVVLDEAYFEYADAADYPDGMAYLARRENLAVLRTFSKAYGLAGCRIGYGVVPEYAAGRTNRVREPFNVNHLAQVAALAALDDTAHLDLVTETNRCVRAELYQGLESMGIEFEKTQTNFVLFRSPIGGAALNEELLRRGIIVRPMTAYGLPDHIRVTVGTAAQNQRFLDALAEIVGVDS